MARALLLRPRGGAASASPAPAARGPQAAAAALGRPAPPRCIHGARHARQSENRGSQLVGASGVFALPHALGPRRQRLPSPLNAVARPETDVAADLTMQHAETGATIHVFGVQHLARETHMGARRA